MVEKKYSSLYKLITFIKEIYKPNKLFPKKAHKILPNITINKALSLKIL